MALPGAHLSKKARKKLKGEPYNPLKSSYENKGQLAAKARQIAAGEVKPEVASLTQEGKGVRRAHAGRVKQINEDFGAAGNQVQEALKNAQAAYDNYIATNNASSQTGTDALTAALAGTRQADLTQANAVGGVLPTGNEAPTLTGAVAGATAGTSGANAMGLGELARLGIEGPGFALGKARAQQAETGRAKAALDKVHEQRTAAKAKIGPAIAKTEKELNAEELAKVSEREREGIAKGQLENEGKSVGVAETEAETAKFNAETARKESETKAQELGINKQLGWAGIHIEEKKLKASVHEATSAAEKAAAEAEQKKYSNATETMIQWLGNTALKQQKPAQLLGLLTSQVSEEQALQLMLHSGSARCVKFAKTKLRLSTPAGAKKNAGKVAAGVVKGSLDG